jgi:type I restriction-modification system DNA methylase subunit
LSVIDASTYLNQFVSLDEIKQNEILIKVGLDFDKADLEKQGEEVLKKVAFFTKQFIKLEEMEAKLDEIRGSEVSGQLSMMTT